jgi:Flp pilus assembly protein TadG
MIRNRNHYPIGRQCRHRSGAVTVELALTISLAFFFFFSALEFSRVAMIRHTIEHAVYEGARQGVVPGGTANDIQQEVQRVLRTVGIRRSTTTVTPQNIQLNTPEVEVKVNVPLDGNLFLPALFFRSKVLERSFTMQRETQANNR